MRVVGPCPCGVVSTISASAARSNSVTMSVVDRLGRAARASSRRAPGRRERARLDGERREPSSAPRSSSRSLGELRLVDRGACPAGSRSLISRHSPIARSTSTATIAIPPARDDGAEEDAEPLGETSSRRRTGDRRACSRSTRRRGRRAGSPTNATTRAAGDGSADSGRGSVIGHGVFARAYGVCRHARRPATRLRRRIRRRRACRGRRADLQRGRQHRGAASASSAWSLPAVEIVVVDDDSPDGTADRRREARRVGSAASSVIERDRQGGARRRVPRRASARRSTRAPRSACRSTPTCRTTRACLPALVANVEHGADLAIGSRYVPGGSTRGLAVAPALAVAVGQPLRGRRARAGGQRRHGRVSAPTARRRAATDGLRRPSRPRATGSRSR